MSHITDRAAEFAAIYIPPGVGAHQRQEMMRAFYAGYAQCLAWQIFTLWGQTPQQSQVLVQEAFEECTVYFKGLSREPGVDRPGGP
jgi:hypothetical protein